MNFLTSLDRSIFVFFNSTIANPVFDATMPYFTDWHKFWIGRIIFAVCWILLLWKGGKKGRIIGLMMIPMIVLTDQLASSVIKPLFAMPRPCHTVDGATLMSPLRLLVDCGSGYSFPSSHATNNTAMAVLLSIHYRKWTPLWATYAALMCISRMVVGVHFPSDVLGGALIGALCALLCNGIWRSLAGRLPHLALPEGVPGT